MKKNPEIETHTNIHIFFIYKKQNLLLLKVFSKIRNIFSHLANATLLNFKMTP